MEKRKRKTRAQRKRNRQRRIIRIITYIIVLAMIAGLVLSIVSCNGKTRSSNYTESDESDGTQTQVARILSVGDIIAHETILDLANTGDGYDFTSLFAQLKNDISSADLAIANVETPLGGGPYSGYPTFNTPDELGLAVIDAGFDVALQASNHAMDSGSEGVRHCISFWKSHASEIAMVGMNDSQEEQDVNDFVIVNGIKIAIFNYTYGLNGYELPEGEEYLVNLLSYDRQSYIESQIQQAASESDFVIVCPHWGEENQVGAPTEDQVNWAKIFVNAGADLIIGTHPHVIENIEWITSDNGNMGLCYYSLGNFVSNQQYTDLVLGGMAYVELIKDESGTRINTEETGVIPVVTHNDKTQTPTVIQTYNLADYTEALAAVHDTKITYDDSFSLEVLKQKAQAVFGDLIIDRVK